MFKKGQSGNKEGRPKGAKGEKTKAWEYLGEFITEEGAIRLISILRESDDYDFLKYYMMLIEYFKPKISRAEVEQKSTPQQLTIIRENISYPPVMKLPDGQTIEV